MEKIHKFKKEVLTFNVYSMIHCYPGDPDYIGKDRDEEFKESIRRGNYEDHKGRIDRESYESMKEVVASDSVFHFYIETIGEIALNTIYDEAQFSIGNLSLDGLKYALQILESYNYNEFFEELDLLSSKFESCNTGKVDEYRFKAVFKKQFKYNLGRNGKISRMFVNSFRCELKKRIKYLEALKENINKMIAIKMEGVAQNMPQYSLAGEDLQLMLNSLHAKTDLRLHNDVKPINDNTMDINYEGIFTIALNHADSPEEMKAYCIRQQKKAERDHFYEKDDFYKDLVKVVADKKELAKYQSEPTPTHVGNFFIAGGGGSGLKYESIELLERIINELCYQGDAQQVAKVSETLEKDQSAQAIQISNEEIEAKKKRDKPGRKKAVPKNAREYLRFVHAESKDTFIYHLKKLSYIDDKKEFAHLIMAINNINMLKEATKKEWKEAFEKELQGVIQTDQNFNYRFNKKDPQLLGTISTELKSIIQKNNLI